MLVAFFICPSPQQKSHPKLKNHLARSKSFATRMLVIVYIFLFLTKVDKYSQVELGIIHVFGEHSLLKTSFDWDIYALGRVYVLNTRSGDVFKHLCK